MNTASPPIASGLCQCGCGCATNLAPHNSTERGWVKGQPLRFVRGHHARLQSAGQPEYAVEDRDYETECWVWQRAIADRNGYGRAHRDGKAVSAHRTYYEEHKGPIPPGYHIDHLCRVHACVNPEHLEAVTPKENLRRGKGTKHTMKEVREIVMRHLAGESAVALGREYGLSSGNIQNLSRGAEAILTWR